MDAAPSATPDALDFVLKFLDGRGILGLRTPLVVEPALLELLELEVPNLRFPFDLSGGAARFQSRRCRLRDARISVDEQRLRTWLPTRRLEDYGIEHLSLRIGEQRIHLGFEARLGDRRVQATARVRVEPAGERRVRVVVDDVRLYGWLSVPGPQLGMALLLAVSGDGPEAAAAATTDGADVTQVMNGRIAAAALAPGPAVVAGFADRKSIQAAGGLPGMTGVSELELDPLDELLWRTLVPMGWRLPSRQGARIAGIQMSSHRVELSIVDGGEEAPAGEPNACPAGDKALAANRLDEALGLYRRAWDAAPAPLLFDRILSLLVASPGRWDEALAFAGAEVERPSNVAAQLAVAAIEAERGQAARAAGRYAELASLARLAGDVEDEIAALRRAADLYFASEPRRATALLEQVLAKVPGNAAAATQLADCYVREGRWLELARLETARIAFAVEPEAQATAYGRLARVLLEHLAQPARAREELERAVRLNTYDAEIWSLLGRAYGATGERDRAIGAFDCVVALAPAPALRADAHVRAAQLLADPEASDVAAALARFQAALAIDPRHPAALAGEAELYTRSGRHADATQVFERAFASVETGIEGHGERRKLLRQEADRLLACGLGDEARRTLDRALEYGEDREVLRKVAALAEQDGRHADAEVALARLTALGEHDAPLRRARALLALGDAAGARAAAQALLSPSEGKQLGDIVTAAALMASADAAGPGLPSTDGMALVLPQALADRVATERVVANASRALADIEGLRAALERLLALEEDPASRIEAALLAVSAGDVERAERHLVAAGEHRGALELRAELLEARGDEVALDETLGRLIRLLDGDATGRAHALVRQGALRARRDRHTEALECYRAALAVLPAGAGEEADAARAGLGRSAYLLGRWDEARSAWEPLHDRAIPPRAQRALRLGEIALRQRDENAAARFYRNALDLPMSGSDAVRSYEALVAIADQRGDAKAAVQALSDAAADSRTGESEPVRAGRLVGAAGRLLQKDDKEGAANVLDRALAIDPDHQGALDGLEQLAVQSGDDRRLAAALERRIDSTRTRPADRMSLLRQLAQVQSEKLQRRDDALATHHRILEFDPNSRPSILFLAQEARRAGDRRSEERSLERVVALPGERFEPSVEAEVHARLAQLHAEAGHEEPAEAEARRALELFPRQAMALGVLDDLLTRSGRITELEPILALRAEVESGFEQALDYDYRRAGLLERQGRRDEALAVYDRIVRVRPSAAAAWERLAALYRDMGAWPELLEVLGRLAARHAAAGQPQEAAGLCVEMAHLAHDRQGDVQMARRNLERALLWDPRCTLALDGLLGLARSANDAQEEDALLGRRLEIEDDPARRELLLVERARSRRERGDVEGAVALLAPVPVERAGEPLLRLRAELSEARGGAALAAADLEQLARRARASGDFDVEREALRRLSRLGAQAGGAALEDLYRRALELDLDNIEAASALVEIERGRDDPAGRLETLENLLRAIRHRAKDPAREAELCFEIARVLRDVGDPGGAAARLREALVAEPDRADIQLALGEVLIERGDMDQAIRMLEQAVERRPDRASFALLALAYETRGDADKAASAFDAAGDAADPRKRAESLELAGREKEALAIWRSMTSDEGRQRAAAILLRWARAAAESPDPLRRAESANLAGQALAEGPCEPDALALATISLDDEGIWALVEKTAAQLPLVEAAALWRAAAALLSPLLGHAALERAVAAAPHPDALAMLARLEGGEAGATRARAALAIDPGHVPSVLALAALARGPDVLAALRLAYRRARPADRPAVSLAAGQLLRERGRDPAAARDAFRRVLDDGGSGETAGAARRALAQLDLESGNEASAINHLGAARAAGIATADDLRQLAELLTERGDHEGAVTALVQAGGPTPLLARALEAAGRHAELVELLERSVPGSPPSEARASLLQAAVACDEHLGDPRRAAALLEQAIPLGPSDSDLWVHLGRIYAGPLREGERAASCYARAHAADPQRTDVLVPLADFHFAVGELDPAEDYYRIALELAVSGGDGESRRERARIHLRLADIAERRGHVSVMEGELRAAAGDGALEAWSRLAEHYRRLGDNARRGEALLAWAESDAERRVLLLGEARPLVDPDEAIRIDDQLSRLDPGDEEVRARLLGRLRTAGNDGALARRLLEEVPRAAEPGRGALVLELGEVSERLGDDETALTALGEALGRHPSLALARRVVAAGRRSGRGAEAARLVEAAFRHDLDAAAFFIAEAWLSPGGDRERAQPVITSIVQRSLQNRLPQGQGAPLRTLLRAAGRWTDLLVEIDAEAHRRSGPARAALELEAAEIVEDQIGDAPRAAARFERAFDADPTEGEVGTHARELYLSAGQPARALAVLDKEIAAVGPVEGAALASLRSEIAAAAQAALTSPARPNLPDGERIDILIDEADFSPERARPRDVAASQPGPGQAGLAAGQAGLAVRSRSAMEPAGAASEATPRRASAGPELTLLVDSAIRHDEPQVLFGVLKAQLDRLPLDAVERITELRQRLGDLARRLKDFPSARNYYELVLAQHPERADALRPLVDIYAAADEWERCAEMLGRLAYLATTPAERAEQTFRQAEVYRVHLGNDELASEGYLKAADYLPEHAPSLRRLIPYYLAEGDSGSLGEVLAELELQAEPVGEASVEAGLGLAMMGDEARAAPLLRGVDAARLAQVIGTFRARGEAHLDAALRASARALAGTLGRSDFEHEPPADLSALTQALDSILRRDPARLGARAAAARLAERTNDVARARAHLAVLAWVEPESAAAQHLADLPPPTATTGVEPVHESAAGPLRDALRLFGPLTIGVGAPLLGAVPLPDWGARLTQLATHFGFAEVEAAVVDEQLDPVWPEPTAPPRLLIRRAILDDEDAVVYAAARALHLLRAGVPVAEERPEDDLAALLTAAAALFDRNVVAASPMARAWLSALRSLPFHPEALPAEQRAALRHALGEAARPGVAATGAAFCVAERYTADRVAFAITGDLGAGLRALAPELTVASSHEKGAERRAQALAEPGAVHELVSYALSAEGLRRLGGLG